MFYRSTFLVFLYYKHCSYYKKIIYQTTIRPEYQGDGRKSMNNIATETLRDKIIIWEVKQLPGQSNYFSDLSD